MKTYTVKVWLTEGGEKTYSNVMEYRNQDNILVLTLRDGSTVKYEPQDYSQSEVSENKMDEQKLGEMNE